MNALFSSYHYSAWNDTIHENDTLKIVLRTDQTYSLDARTSRDGPGLQDALGNWHGRLAIIYPCKKYI